MNCNYCDKEFDNNISKSNHSRHCKLNPLKITLNYRIKKNQWSNTEYVMTEDTKQKISKSGKGIKRTQEFKDNLSIVAKNRSLGGHTSKRKLYFKKSNGEVIYLQSSYEIKMAEILEQNNIQWSRPDPLNWIDDSGNNHRYYPDFKINEVYFDTKNDYLIKKDEVKINKVIEQNEIILFVLDKNSINIENISNLISNAVLAQG